MRLRIKQARGTEEMILNARKIRTEMDYEIALKRVKILFDAKINTQKGVSSDN